MSEFPPEDPGSRRNFDVNQTVPGLQFLSNSICTAKYTCLTFLPMNLFLQITKMANFYFLFMGCI